jgi:hypothetical protein
MGSDVHADWRSRVLWRSFIYGSVLAAALTLIAGAFVPEPGPVSMIWSAPAALVPLTGAYLAARTADGPSDAGAVLWRTGLHMFAVAGLGIAQLLIVAVTEWFAGELAWVPLGSVAACFGIGIALSLILVIAGPSVRFVRLAGPGTPLPLRWSLPVTLVSIVLIALGVNLGVAENGGGLLGDVTVLLGLRGEVVAPVWLWIARAATLTLIAALIALLAYARRRRPESAP